MKWRVLMALGVVIATLAVLPIVTEAVDWGMDGDLTPGDWEPHQWWLGAFLSVMYLIAYGWPLAVLAALLPIPIAFQHARRVRAARGRCPSCEPPVEIRNDECPHCGVPAPRRPGERAQGVATQTARATAQVLVWTMWLAALVIVLASGIGWVILELNEDAFGRRAQAAAASGADEHHEVSTFGSYLMWSKERGYSSHRD